MILTIDVGNSNIVLGVFENDNIKFIARMSTKQNVTADEIAANLHAVLNVHNTNFDAIHGAIISSVVPQITTALANAVKMITGVSALIVGPGMKTGINIKIDNPAQLGSDLLVDSVAASALYPKPVIVADMGTATTLTVIDANNCILGGAICPGVRTSLNALIEKTAQLPQINLESPKKVIGSNTVDCIRSGVIFGNACMLDGMIDRIEAQLGRECFVVATGGLSEEICKQTKHNIEHNPTLLLQGLYILYKKNAAN